ncbi:aldehyde dehydrogenase (NAD+) [Spinactinospora alkalitolerans]|uniref:Aldehyde dehydrogenase (NAD+) n=1 Tax=Spinactinospora alkalitolerans TaxID=687207 RepID=A0A852TU50_9ACTN|nr:aldehyde dehydrogenase family protein [Spinactinospora alkalitolerans]NYE47966.1 aldehyde dehydrogenase (NAD+) [Spinactinospora alkalitolerans]
MTPTHEGRNYIAGEWVASASGRTFDRRNPADQDDLVGVFPDSTAADSADAVSAVADAAPAWGRVPAPERALVLQRAADILERRADELAVELVREEGKTLAEATAETRRTPQNLRFYAGEALRIAGDSFPSEGQGAVYTTREPVGVVGAVTPWNFPLNIPSRKLGPALAAGNGVVYKPSPVSPLLGQRLVEALLEAGLAPGAIALVQGGAEAGAAVVGDHRVGAVTFTGSTETGRRIHSAVGPSRRCQLEMGGKNPVLVLPDADLDRATALIVKGAFGLSGQACTGTSRVLVHESVHDRLVELLAAAADSLTVGPGLGDGVDMGPLAADFQLRKTLDYVAIGCKEGAEPVAGAQRPAGPGTDRGFFVRPTVFTGCTTDMRIVREEIFGPVIAVQRFGTFEEALTLANDSDYGLAAGIVTRDLNRALEFARSSKNGLVKINQPTTGMGMTVPFGGLKESSTQTFKEQAGNSMMMFYTQEKSVYISALS